MLFDNPVVRVPYCVIAFGPIDGLPGRGFAILLAYR